MFFLSSQIRHRRHNLSDRTGLGINGAGSRSREFQKNLIVARTASR